MNVAVTTAKPRSIYVTARDPRTGRSKTITIRGDRITTASVIGLVLQAVKRMERKAG